MTHQNDLTMTSEPARKGGRSGCGQTLAEAFAGGDRGGNDRREEGEVPAQRVHLVEVAAGVEPGVKARARVDGWPRLDLQKKKKKKKKAGPRTRPRCRRWT